MSKARNLALCAALLFSSSALAQKAHVVGRLPGYQCMMLNITEAQAMDPKFDVPVYAAPAVSTPPAGFASMEVAVRSPLHIVAGFAEALFPTGATVWIKKDMLEPYHSLGDPTAKCVPALLSNGRPGFDFYH